MGNLKILHFADIQVEARKHNQRAIEYKLAFEELSKVIRQNEIEVVVFSGDAFEHPQPNDVERMLWIDFLNDINEVSTLREVVMIDGNHDIIQRNNSYSPDGHHYDMVPSPIGTMVRAINSPKVRYFDTTGIFNSLASKEVKWAVWGHRVKYANNNEPYSPWLENDKDDRFGYIELYHDPIKAAKGWDDRPIHGADKHVALDAFKSNLVLAGDIHCPDMIKFRDEISMFTYPSSLIIRDYGEGDYYDGLRRYQSGNTGHGYNLIEYDTEHKQGTLATFVIFSQPVTYNTIRFTDKFGWSDLEIDNLRVNMIGSHLTRIRFVVEAGHNKFHENEARMIQQIKAAIPNAIFDSPMFFKDIVDGQVGTDELKITKDQLVTDEQIRSIAAQYIEHRVSRSRSIPNEDKEAVVAELISMFEDELEAINRTNVMKILKLDAAKIDNFMSFGDGVKIDFGIGDLVRIAGANGIGKTSIMHFVNWMFCDRISWSQNMVFKRENYLGYFNDSRPDSDVVNGSLEFEFNGRNYVLVKSLTRTWTDPSLKGKENWMDGISAVPALAISLECLDGSLNLTTFEDVSSWIENNIGSFYDLSFLMFVNYGSLYDLINSPANKLSDQILYNLGLNFFDTMMQRYDNIRNTKMAEVYKPQTSVPDLVQSIERLEDKLKRLDESEQEERAKKIEKRDFEDKLILSKEELTSQVINVGYTLEQANVGIEKIDGILESNAEEVDNLAKLNSENEKSMLEIPTLEAKVQQFRTSLETVKETKNDRKEKSNMAEARIALTKEQNKSVYAELKTGIAMKKVEFDKELTTLENDMTRVRTSALQTKSLYEAESSNVEQKYKLTISEAESKAKLHESEAKRLDLEAKTLREEADRLEKDTTCPTCKRQFDLSTVEAIKTKILEKLNLAGSLSSKVLVEMDKAIASQDEAKEAATALRTEITERSEKYMATMKEFADELKRLDDHGKELVVKQNTEIAEMEAAMEKDARIVENLTTIEKLEGFVKQNADEIVLIEKEISKLEEYIGVVETELKGLRSLGEIILRRTNEMNELRLKAANLTTKKEELIASIPILKKNEELKTKIDDLDVILNSVKVEIEAIDESISQIGKDVYSTNISIKNDKGDIEMHVKYRRTDMSLRIYKQLLGKDGLVAAIFGTVTSMLNTKLSDLLSGVNFKLFFDERGQLRMRDLTKKNATTRAVTFSSGMESTFLGLSLLYVLREMNASKRFSPMFIDEISGKLNDGESLPYDAINYQERFVEMLDRMKATTGIWIVDHVIEDLGEDAEVVVIPTSEGTTVQSRKIAQ